MSSRRIKSLWSVGLLALVLSTGASTTSGQAEKPVSLQITASRTALREGETAQLRVLAKFADGSVKDVTSTRTGTKYITSSLGEQLTVDSEGLARAITTKGQIDHIESIFVTHQTVMDTIHITIAKKDALSVTAPKTTLRVGETVQLVVQQILLDGSTRDLTDPNTGTTYRTTSESKLIPEPDGRVTCVGTWGERRESAIITVQNGEHHGSISFRLLSSGPGPSLELVAEKTVLHEGEQTQLHAFKPLPGKKRRNVTDVGTGTRYLAFPGLGKHDPSVVSISDKGVAKAPQSIAGFNKLTVIVFVRNGNDVGWIKLTVLPKGSPKGK